MAMGMGGSVGVQGIEGEEDNPTSSLARRLINRYERLKGERKNWDHTAELIGRYVMPGRARFFEDGVDWEEAINWRHREKFDDTAVRSAKMLAASLHGNLTSPATKWFEQRYRNDFLRNSKRASAWLEQCSMTQWHAIQDSNFNLECAEFYLDAVGYGTAHLLHHENIKWGSFDGFRMATPHAREMYFEEDFYGRPIATYRRRMYTATALIDKFGYDNVPENVQSVASSSASTQKQFSLIYAIWLAGDKMPVPSSVILPPERRPYQGAYILVESATILGDIEGYYEIPDYALRWQRTAGSKYGHSPAHDCLSDILTLNQLVEIILVGAEKAVDPPILAEERGLVGVIDLAASGLTFVRGIDRIKPFQTGQHFDVGELQRASLQEAVRQAFFVDQLQLKESPAMTATEVQVRYELMQRLLGPPLTRLAHDFLKPFIERGFYMLLRNGAFEPMPAEVEDSGETVDIEYVGPLSKSQKMHDIQATERWLVALQQAAGVHPDILDTVEWDELSYMLADRLGVPATLQRDKRDVRRDRRARQEKMQQAENMALAESAANTLQSAGKAAEVLSLPGVS